MKKIILCSLVAMMAVTAANAEIASVEYVDTLVAEEQFVIEDGKEDEFVPTVHRVQVMIDNSQTDLIADVANNTAAIAENAQAIADEATARENADTTLDGKITALDTAYKAADKAISDTIGNVTEGKTVVEMITEAQTAATYDDTAVRGLISGEVTAREDADTAINTKIGTVEEGKTVVGMIATAQETADAAVKKDQVGIDNNFAISDECKAEGAVCSLVVRAGVAGWEKIRY